MKPFITAFLLYTSLFILFLTTGFDFQRVDGDMMRWHDYGILYAFGLVTVLACVAIYQGIRSGDEQ